MKVLCFSVRLASLTSISEKCYLATSFNGREDFIPKSQVLGRDYGVKKSDAYWISAWILGKKDLQYSGKKETWFDSESGDMLPTYHFEKHIPEMVSPIEIQPKNELRRE